MLPRFKYGLIVGAVGLFLNVCFSALSGICGPLASLVAGAVAGFLAAREEKMSTKGKGAQAGAIAGGIASGLMLIGQLIGGALSLILVQTQHITVLGNTPPDTSNTAATIGYYVAGIGVGFCFGLVGIALGAGAGAGTGYLGTPDYAPTAPSNTL